MKTKTVIIGGGISGLSIGHYLNKINSDFLIIEKNNRLGGNIFSENINGFICENGPNTILLNNIEIKELIEDINLSNEVVLVALKNAEHCEIGYMVSSLGLSKITSKKVKNVKDIFSVIKGYFSNIENMI